jgi:hypothetical protein
MITTHATLARAGRHGCARNQHCHKSPSGSAPPHGLQVAGERGLIGAAKDLAEGVVAFGTLVLSTQAPLPRGFYFRLSKQ